METAKQLAGGGDAILIHVYDGFARFRLTVYLVLTIVRTKTY